MHTRLSWSEWPRNSELDTRPRHSWRKCISLKRLWPEWVITSINQTANCGRPREAHFEYSLSLSFFSKNFVTSSRFLDTMSKKMRLQDLVEEVGKEVILSIFVFVSSTEFLLFGVSTSLPPSSSLSSLGYSIGISVGADSKREERSRRFVRTTLFRAQIKNEIVYPF